MIKKGFKKEFIGLTMAMVLAMTVVGCGSDDSKSAENGGDTSSAVATNDTQSDTDSGEEKVVNREYDSSCVGVFSISINPEIEFEINESGEISAVIYMNQDAEDAYSELNLEGMSVEEAVGVVVSVADEMGYLKDGNDVTLNYGATGYASADESMELINAAREAVVESLEESGKDSAVVLNVTNYVQEQDSVCDLCYGVGAIICDSCGGISYGNGMVKCDLCMGSGYYDDGHDTGDGDSTGSDTLEADPEGACRRCHGTGLSRIEAQTCYTCGGTGLCINCGGSGNEINEDGTVGACHACGGSGDCLQSVCEGGIMPERYETCEDCGGTGLAPEGGYGDENSDNSLDNADARPDGICNRCDGIGFMTCNNCGGSLMSTCYRCNGTGINVH